MPRTIDTRHRPVSIAGRSTALPFLLCIALPADAPAMQKGVVLPPATHTVGNGFDCDFATLQAAVSAAASGDSIHMVSGSYLLLGGGVTVENKSLSIVGGYANCAAANPDPENPTELVHNGSDSVLTVDRNIAGVGSVLLRHFVLSGGNGGASKGGGVSLSGSVTLRLDHVIVEDNVADYGGGIRVHGEPPSPTLRLEGGSLIGGTSNVDGGNNAFQMGGGIHCDSGGHIEWVDAAINFNSALTGGGIFLNGCDLTTPAPVGSGLRIAEIRENRTLQGAGGIGANLFSTLQMESVSNRQIRIVGNRADDDQDNIGDGGGIWLLSAEAHASGVQIEENSAANGGGVYLSSSASLDMDRGNPTGANCPVALRCSSLYRNSASVHGGGILAFGGSDLDLRQTFIESNQAGDSPVALFSGVTVHLVSVQISGNRATNPAGTELIYANDSSLEFRNVSLAGNDSVRVFELDNTTSLGVTDSILWQPGAAIITGDGTGSVNGGCLNASESVTIAAETHDPGFWFGSTPPPTLGPPPLLYLAADSPNLDACDIAPLPNPAFDVAGWPRVQDLGEVPDLAGPLDRGALEWQPPLFADGFEG